MENDMNLTPEQALADVKAVRRDRSDSHWLDCAIVLADLHANDMLCIDDLHKRTAKRAESFRTEIGKLRAELEKMAAHLAERTKERDSARRDAANVARPLLDSIAKLRDELDLKEHAGRIAAAEIKLRKRQLADLRAELDAKEPAPSEGGGWSPHTPGDPMPCEGDMLVDILTVCGPLRKREASSLRWYRYHHHTDIIGWRPALAEVAT
jgi:hypothetical protein